MFLFDTNYFLERIVLPGGLADYISEFLVQFYYMPVLGGAIIALLLMGIQAAVWGLMKQYGARHDFPGYLLSFLPSIALWCAMGDQNVLLSFVVALFGALVIGWIHNRFHNRLVKVVFELVIIQEEQAQHLVHLPVAEEEVLLFLTILSQLPINV